MRALKVSVGWVVTQPPRAMYDTCSSWDQSQPTNSSRQTEVTIYA